MIRRSPLMAALLLLAAPAAATVDIDWVTVGGPGNACETQSQGCFGTVAAPYRIGQFEVTNVQYAEFLNSVAATDTFALYNTNMGLASSFGGITRSGNSGSYSYTPIAGREDRPVNYVSFWDAIRFANWLHNDQPTGVQNDSTTENGAYTITPTGVTNNTVMRNPAARVVVANEDEWYKAAFYDTGAMTYFNYPAASDSIPSCAAPGATANTANCSFVNADLTDVGSYTGAGSPNGTFDQGGNAWEWNDAIILADRVIRGGNFNGSPLAFAASFQFSEVPTLEGNGVGFRVASPIFPSPVPSMNLLGSILLWCMLGLVGIRSLRSCTEAGVFESS